MPTVTLKQLPGSATVLRDPQTGTRLPVGQPVDVDQDVIDHLTAQGYQFDDAPTVQAGVAGDDTSTTAADPAGEQPPGAGGN